MEPTQDTWTTDAEGRYVGHDGFVCPRDTHELLEWFPTCLDEWVGSTLKGVYDPTLHEERVQEFALVLLQKRIVETFDPERLGGANKARFFAYIYNCLIRKLYTLHKYNHQQRRVGNNHTVSFGTDNEAGEYSEEMVSQSSLDDVQRLDLDAQIYIGELREYLSSHKSHSDELVKVFDATLAGLSEVEIAELLNVGKHRVIYAKRIMRKFLQRSTR